jgi:hypothetical protein
VSGTASITTASPPPESIGDTRVTSSEEPSAPTSTRSLVDPSALAFDSASTLLASRGPERSSTFENREQLVAAANAMTVGHETAAIRHRADTWRS